jgi:hypothetical protein
MGKKSRAKRERREARESMSPFEVFKLFGAVAGGGNSAPAEEKFKKDVEAIAAALRQYDLLDAALALAVSDCWPANVASPVKHLLAWAVLLGLQPKAGEPRTISTYEEFAEFTRQLHTAWPAFPMLEDFSPEADWGQVKAKLGSEYVPVFYGGSIERLPDFVQAFRITHAGNAQALADIELALAVHADLIAAVPAPGQHEPPSVRPGHCEVPPEHFWNSCSQALRGMGERLGTRLRDASQRLTAELGAFRGPLTWAAFGDAVMTGQAAPFLGLSRGEQWIPVSVRSGPGVVFDDWAPQASAEFSDASHVAVGRFIAERLRRVFVGPLTLMVGERGLPQFVVSCVAASSVGVHVFCGCSQASLPSVYQAAKSVYAALMSGDHVWFRTKDGRGIDFGTVQKKGLTFEDVHIVIVPAQGATAPSMVGAPDRPARAMPLADLISIVDELEDLKELERFWSYMDEQRGTLAPFSRALGDVFAAFRDTHGVLVDGAVTPTMISLDPHWGSERRFRTLAEFWSAAPNYFPDGTQGWQVKKMGKGVVEMRCRHSSALAYSAQAGVCTFQAVVTINKSWDEPSGRMLDLFAQMIADALQECAPAFAGDEFFSRPHIVLDCDLAEGSAVVEDQQSAPVESFPRVVDVSLEERGPVLRLRLSINASAVQAGLNNATTAAFEARCLRETLQVCYAALNLPRSENFERRFDRFTTAPARYHLQMLRRLVDVPDFANPVVATATEYKLARKALAVVMREIGLQPGRYELEEAKTRIIAAREELRRHLEARMRELDRDRLILACVEQQDAALVAERMKEMRVRQSLLHEVDYDRGEALTEARKEFGTAARHYRYLVEKALSSQWEGPGNITKEALRELLGLVDWYMVMAGASDVLQNGVDVARVEINDSFVPAVFYSDTWQQKEEEYSAQLAKYTLGQGVDDADFVRTQVSDLLEDVGVQSAFEQDVGFSLRILLAALEVLSLPPSHGLADNLALIYLADPEQLADTLANTIEGLSRNKAGEVIAFLTLSGPGIRRLPGKPVDEEDVPFWERGKRLHRYAIRPLVAVERQLAWGAEHASRTQNIWLAALRDGILPADFPWPHVEESVRSIKQSIEKAMESRAEEIFKRHTPFVMRGIDFSRRFKKERFEDVGDYDILAYWPLTNTVIFAECKYNQPAHTMKDSRRLRDRIYGKSETDRAGQFSRIHGRREFLAKNRARMLGLLNWPEPAPVPPRNLEVYISRDLHYWMVHPPYEVPTEFARIDALHGWLLQVLAA